jgi:2-keto-3-deoxy-L-rhamnonate aldolase RhmA
VSDRAVLDLRSLDAPAVGVLVTFHCAGLVELYGRLGFTWLLLDAEHAPLSPQTCRELTRAADPAGLPCVVRVPEIRPSVIEDFLDAGVAGILASHVESAEDVRALAAAANERILIAALLESRRAMEQLDTILAVPELDCAAVGPNDLGLSLGIADGPLNPQVRALVDHAYRAIDAAGKKRMTVVADAAAAGQAIAEGMLLIAVPDTRLIAHAGTEFIRKALPSSPSAQSSRFR